MVVALLPGSEEARGLLGLMLLQHSRRATRVDGSGDMVLIQDQDRRGWDRAEVAEGIELLATLGEPVGPYAIQAAIAACHSSAPTWESTDWMRIVSLYDRLWALTASPVVALNRAVAIGYAEGPEAGLAAIEGIDLSGYHAYHASRGEMLRRAGEADAAGEELARALQSSANTAERRLIEGRLAALRASSG